MRVDRVWHICQPQLCRLDNVCVYESMSVVQLGCEGDWKSKCQLEICRHVPQDCGVVVLRVLTLSEYALTSC